MDDSNLCSPTDESGNGPRLISHSPIGHVVQCGCGHLHLNLQYMTLRFEPPAFRELAALLLIAQRRLDGAPRQQEASASPSCDAGPARPMH